MSDRWPFADHPMTDPERLAEIVKLLGPITGIDLRDVRHYHIEDVRRARAIASGYSPCQRCGLVVVELRGGICGTCGDDLRDEANAIEAGILAENAARESAVLRENLS